MATLGLPATAEAAARARVVTAGNPLAVTELVRRPDALARLALDDPIPLSGRLVEVFAEEAGELGADVQLVVALTALAGGSATLVVDAARALGLDEAALGRAEAAALVDLDGDHVAPRHPLVGSAVYSSLSPEQQRRLHAAVAEALPPGRTDERARHLAAAAAGPDEGLAAALEQVAAAAAGRGAPAVAAAGLERAAGITPDAGRRTERLLAAAEAAWAAGDAAWATRLCDEVARAAGGPVPPWRAEALAGSIAARSGSLDVARRSLLGAAEPAGDAGPGGRQPDRRRGGHARLQPGGCRCRGRGGDPRHRAARRRPVRRRARAVPDDHRHRGRLRRRVGGGRAAGRPDPAADAGCATRRPTAALDTTPTTTRTPCGRSS